MTVQNVWWLRLHEVKAEAEEQQTDQENTSNTNGADERGKVGLY